MKKAKPRGINMYRGSCAIREDNKYWPMFIDGSTASLKDAKRLHKWLGRAIKYLEYKNESN